MTQLTLQQLAKGAVVPKRDSGSRSIKVIEEGNQLSVPEVIGKTNAEAVNLRNLMGGSGKTVEFSLENTGAAPLEVYLGTAVSVGDNYIGLGIAQPGNFSADLEDETGATAPKLRAFNDRIMSANGVIVTKISVFAAAANAMRDESFNKVEFDWDGNSCRKTGRIAVSDTQVNGVFHEGAFPMSHAYGVRFTIPANTAFNLELELSFEGIASQTPVA